MIILGIETSCDETAAAIVENGTKVLASVVASSQEIHKKYGGIIPEQAAREQIKSIVPVLSESINQLPGKSIKQIDAIAVTSGPGLIGSLLVGVETAKTLAFAWQKPIVPVNHLIAHVYANFVNNNETIEQCNNKMFPALCLIVSGGHTELLLMKDHGKFEWIGGTRDDAAGECFDKCSRLLGLGYPGGPAIAAAAANLQPTTYKLQTTILPRPMINQNNFDFSFSGLKTAVLNLVKNRNQSSNEAMKQPVSPKASQGGWNNHLAYQLQEAITDVLVTKTIKAAQKYEVKSILVGGGVAANDRLREKFNQTMKQSNNPPTDEAGETMKLFIPDKNLCTDNAASIAAAAFFNYHPIPWQKIKANPSLEIF